jgi:hypothetical protein
VVSRSVVCGGVAGLALLGCAFLGRCRDDLFPGVNQAGFQVVHALKDTVTRVVPVGLSEPVKLGLEAFAPLDQIAQFAHGLHPPGCAVVCLLRRPGGVKIVQPGGEVP